MSRQDQRVGEGAIAVQATGDAHVHVGGVSPEQMCQILGVLAQQLPAYTQVARQIVDDRLSQFKEWVVNEFARDPHANSEAFKDPDFQHLLTFSQQCHARYGSEQLGETLVKILTERSKQKGRTRVSLTLNSAADISANLTQSDLAYLSLIFLFQYSQQNGISDYNALIKAFRDRFAPFIAEIDDINASIQYLESTNCLLPTRIHRRTASVSIRENYSGVFSSGFTEEDLLNAIRGNQDYFQSLRSIIMPCLNDVSRIQFSALNRTHLIKMLTGRIPNDLFETVAGFSEANIISQEQIMQRIESDVPEFSKVVLWDRDNLLSVSLSNVGIVIGHANYKRLSGDKADISAWIK